MMDIVAGLTGVSAVLLLAAALWPSEGWVRTRPTDMAVNDRKLLPALGQVVGVIGLATGGSLLFMWWGVHLLFAIISASGTLLVILPMIREAQVKKRAKQGRQEALRLSQFVVGRLTARVQLPTALADAIRRHDQGGMALAICADDLREVIQALALQEDFSQNLTMLAGRFVAIPELASMFTSYAVMARSNLDFKAKVTQAEDIAEQLTRMDAIRNDLDVELTASRGTRFVMLLLMVGLILYLTMAGGAVGEALLNTVPGNLAIGFALFSLGIAQLVANRIEQMPLIRF